MSWSNNLKGGDIMRKGIWGCLVVLLVLSLFTSGCYYFSAKKEIESAQQAVNALKGQGGPTKVPYEYCSAEKFLEMARGEFSQNDFAHAKEFAIRSKAAADAGMKK